ncbi:MAG TPA: HAD-IC family P-type ATPase [Phycisphaerales bacterium]|nr:HAD-IC family P-type ATPase [Phycisphaerales bacterium]
MAGYVRVPSSDATAAAERAWHTMSAERAFEALGASPEGLASDEAARRLGEFGRNEVPLAGAAAWWRIIGRQFASPLIYLLIAAGVLSIAIGEHTDAGFIFAVVVLNAVIGTIQEWRAERSTQALQRLLSLRAAVVRDGEVREIDAAEVVAGDVVVLESGNRVPADLRLFRATGLEADESLLTGESMAVHKDATWMGEPGTPVADQRNIANAGSTIVRGRGRGVVVATGADSAVGRVASEMHGAEAGRPPLFVRLDRFSKVVGVAVVIAAFAVALIGVFGQDRAPTEMVFFAVALAVSAIPEGLPVAITVALTVASRRMASRGVLVRRLGAVEGLGSCTLIASDKTGTLTCNELTVREVRLASGGALAVSGEGFVPEGEVLPVEGSAPVDRDELDALARAAALCNEGDLHRDDGRWAWRGDPTDVALLALAHKLGVSRDDLLDRYQEITRIVFEPERRYAAHFHEANGGARVLVKGAPERVLEMCPGLGGQETRALLGIAEDMAGRGMRVLAIAEGDAPPSLDPSRAPPEPEGLRLLGFVGMIDPLRPGVADAVRACRAAGITVSMVTGDHPVTALAISRELGLAVDSSQVVTGAELAALDGPGLADAVRRARVFARVAPEQKLDVVQAEQAAGHFVAVTGDGVNDAPALRAANIGVAMGRAGTDVARDAADLVITDDNFVTIVAGVEEGRIAYDNVRKCVFLLISTGAAEVVLALLAVAAGTPLPLLPVQLLWLNLVTNGIQHVALAFEPGEGDILKRAPRPPTERIFNRVMIERTLVAAAVMGCVAFAAFNHLLASGWSETDARNAILLLMVLFENVHVGNCRSETVSALRMSPLRSPVLLAATAGAFLVHALAMHTPGLNTVLGAGPLPLGVWAAMAGLALSIFVVMELHKVWWRRRMRRTGRV